MKKYQMRRAAGIYWLIDMEQGKTEYQRPIPMNETGAFIWERASAGKTAAVIAKELAEHYSVSEAETIADVRQFFELLEAKGIREV